MLLFVVRDDGFSICDTSAVTTWLASSAVYVLNHGNWWCQLLTESESDVLGILAVKRELNLDKSGSQMICLYNNDRN